MFVVLWEWPWWIVYELKNWMFIEKRWWLFILSRIENKAIIDRDVSRRLSRRRRRLKNVQFFFVSVSGGGWEISIFFSLSSAAAENFLRFEKFWKSFFVLRNFCIKKEKNDNWESAHKKLDEKNSGNWSWLLKILKIQYLYVFVSGGWKLFGSRWRWRFSRSAYISNYRWLSLKTNHVIIIPLIFEICQMR